MGGEILELHEFISELDKYDPKLSKDENSFCKNILMPWLIELCDRRATELKPAVKFLTNTIDKQISHIRQEFNEVLDAKYEFINCTDPDRILEFKNHFAEELVDLQGSCETMLAILGYADTERREIRRQVRDKNSSPDRNYYREADN